jgi:hypothetical protein
VKVEVTVTPDGRVMKATTNRPAGDKLGACVAAAVKSVTFKKTPSGGSFSYPFVFGTPAPATGPTPAAPPTDASAAAALDRTMISDGVAKVKAKIAACGTGPNAAVKGKVQIKVTVAPAGTVTSAAVVSAPAEALGACVASVMKGAAFAKTAQGGSFSYPFVF